MDKIKKITVIALFVGLQACSVQFLDILFHGYLPPLGNLGFSCIAFLGWPTYFMSGCNIKGGIKAFIAFALGILAGIVICLLSGVFGFAGAFASVIPVFIVAWLLFYYEAGPGYCNHLAACYISCGTFFMFLNYVPGATFLNIFITEMIYLTVGLFYGWMTIAFRQWVEKRQAARAQGGKK